MVKAMFNQEALATWIAREDAITGSTGTWGIERFDLNEMVEVLDRKINGNTRVAIRQIYEDNYSRKALVPPNCLIIIGDGDV